MIIILFKEDNQNFYVFLDLYSYIEYIFFEMLIY